MNGFSDLNFVKLLKCAVRGSCGNLWVVMQERVPAALMSAASSVRLRLLLTLMSKWHLVFTCFPFTSEEAILFWRTCARHAGQTPERVNRCFSCRVRLQPAAAAPHAVGSPAGPG